MHTCGRMSKHLQNHGFIPTCQDHVTYMTAFSSSIQQMVATKKLLFFLVLRQPRRVVYVHIDSQYVHNFSMFTAAIFKVCTRGPSSKVTAEPRR